MMDAIFKRLDEMVRTSGIGIAICHQQGKAAVYVSQARKYLVKYLVLARKQA